MLRCPACSYDLPLEPEALPSRADSRRKPLPEISIGEYRLVGCCLFNKPTRKAIPFFCLSRLMQGPAEFVKRVIRLRCVT
jgi:hypothetical protein